jgi:hypothetical protein
VKFQQIRPTTMIWIGLCVAILLQGCALPAYLPGQQAIGNLRVVGENVRVNQRPAIDGETIQHDDNVTTGAKSSAYIQCYTCGIIQLDKYTDPRFSHLWQHFNPNIVIDSLKTGQVYVETNKTCQLTVKPEQPVKSVLEASDIKYNVKVDQDETIITVLKGAVRLTEPSNLTITESQQVIITKDGVKSVRNLSQPEQEEVTRWRNNFPQPEALTRSGSKRVCDCAD